MSFTNKKKQSVLKSTFQKPENTLEIWQEVGSSIYNYRISTHLIVYPFYTDNKYFTITLTIDIHYESALNALLIRSTFDKICWKEKYCFLNFQANFELPCT